MSLLLTVLDGRITLRGVLGTGGMGEVHRAWDAGLERPVAVKFVRSADPKEADRLLLEARLQARVEHPNVVRVLDTGTLEGRPCILLQLVEGRTFADLRTKGDWRVEVALAAQAARGLGAAHRMGLVHRDVKPANILVEDTEEGPQARLTDFGLARDEEGGLTRSGLMMGTVDFMAPEQVAGLSPVDFRADIYGLGATLYAVLAGRPPFRDTPGPTGEARSTRDLHGATPEGDLHPGGLLRRVLEEDPRSLTEAVQGLPRDLATVVAKAMEKAPERRYASAEALADDLERVLKGQAILARPMGWMERGLRWSRRNPAAARALGASLTVMLATGAFATWNSRRSTLAALDAAQLGGEAKAFELRLRMAHLAPAHDLRSVHKELRAGLVRFAARRGAASAAVDYARGRVLLLLDELDQARAALESSRALGFRGVELDAALGLVYGRIYERDLPTIESLQDPAFRERRLAELQERYWKPALTHLAAAGSDPLLQAEAALLQRRYDDTRRLALAARSQDGERAEATLLAARAWYQEGRDAYSRRGAVRAEACALEGIGVARGLMEDLRSDPSVPILLGGCKDLLASVVNDRGGDAKALVSEGLAFADQALALDVESREAWILKIQLLANRAKIASQQEGDGLERAKTMLEATRQLVALDPLNAKARMLLSYGLYAVGHEMESRNQDPAAFHLEGFRAGMEADHLQPWNASGLHRALMNAIEHIDGQLKRGKDPTELLAAAESAARRLEQLEGRGGLHPHQVIGTVAHLRSILGQVAWIQGRDPDPYLAEAVRNFQELRAAEPDHTEHLAYLCWIAQKQMDSRVITGREVESIFQAILPAANEAVRRMPDQPMLKAYRASLFVFSMAGRVNGRFMALDPGRRRAAHRAMEEAMAASRHPAVLQARGLLWLAEAEAGFQASADKSIRDFEGVIHSKASQASNEVSLVRALRIRRAPGDLKRAMALIETLRKEEPADPDLMLYQAILLKDLGRHAEAWTWRQKALASQPLLAGHPMLVSAFGRDAAGSGVGPAAR